MDIFGYLWLEMHNNKIHVFSYVTVVAIEERLKLQGLPVEIYAAARECGLSNQVVMAACGNAWPVAVVTKIIRQLKLAMAW